MSLHLTHGAADRPPLGTLVRRRVVQVAIAAAAEPGYELDRVVLALCDDSTIWWHGLFPYNDWHRLPARAFGRIRNLHRLPARAFARFSDGRRRHQGRFLVWA